jgi:deoxyhypusine synthase
MVPDSINIPLENIRFSQIPFDKTDKIVLYSRTSSGAYMAYRYLVSKGYVNLFVLEGGRVLEQITRLLKTLCTPASLVLEKKCIK